MDLNTMKNTVSPKVSFSGNAQRLDLNTVKGTGEKMITLGLKNSVEKLTMQKKSRMMDTLADSKVESQAANISIDPSTAIEINPDIAYSIGTAAAGQHLLVKINTTNMLKLTAVTSFSAATTFQTFVFTLNDQNEINQIVQSVDYFGSFDVVSFLPKGGYYYVLVYITAGGGDMQFQLAKSDACSAAEPNDTPSTLAAKINGFKLTDMFDNINDLDAVHLNVTKPNDAATTPETMSMSFIFDAPNTKGNVNLYIYNVQQGTWGIATTLPVPFIDVKWTPPEFGDYYVYVQPTSADLLNKGYMFSAGQLSANVAKVNGFKLTDMFDNIYDMDTVHLSVPKPNDAATMPETMSMSFVFNDSNTKGTVNLYIYNVNQGAWSVAAALTAPFIDVKWTPPEFGDYYVYVNPTSANLLNKGYMFSAGQLSANAAKVNSFNLTDMFDSLNDIDTVHLNITKPNDTATTPEPVYMSFIFKDINTKGNVNLCIINVKRGTWSVETTPLAAPFVGLKWTPPEFGDYYVYVQPTTANLVNKEYTFSAGQLSAIIVPFRINVGSVTSYPNDGKYDGDFWVNGSSCVILGWARGVKDGSNAYGCPDTPLEIEITGKDAGDVKSAYAVTDKDGNFKMTVSLPYSYGKDGGFSGYKYIHHYDRQPVGFYGINGKAINSNMDVILNVVD